MSPKILAFAGSTRVGSFNKRLIALAASGARGVGGEVTLIDLRDFPLPLYDGDLEQSDGLPHPAIRLRALLLEHHGLLLACPEYNSSIPGVLKNAIDWCSRGPNKSGDLCCFAGKVAGLLSASPGALGGQRGLVTVRSILGNIGVLVLAGEVTVPRANEAFEGDGGLKDAKLATRVERLAATLVETIAKLRA